MFTTGRSSRVSRTRRTDNSVKMGIFTKEWELETGMKTKVSSIVVCILALCTAAIFAACDTLYTLKNDVTIEVGTPISIDVFFENTPDDCEFLTDVSGINTNEPAVYQLRIRYGKNTADVVLMLDPISVRHEARGSTLRSAIQRPLSHVQFDTQYQRSKSAM